MKIFFEASREILVTKTGKTEIQTVIKEVWQTPTKISLRIYNAADPVTAYGDWVLFNEKEEQIPIHDENNRLVGFQSVNLSEAHYDEFNAWVTEMREAGYDVKACIT